MEDFKARVKAVWRREENEEDDLGYWRRVIRALQKLHVADDEEEAFLELQKRQARLGEAKAEERKAKTRLLEAMDSGAEDKKVEWLRRLLDDEKETCNRLRAEVAAFDAKIAALDAKNAAAAAPPAPRLASAAENSDRSMATMLSVLMEIKKMLEDIADTMTVEGSQIEEEHIAHLYTAKNARQPQTQLSCSTLEQDTENDDNDGDGKFNSSSRSVDAFNRASDDLFALATMSREPSRLPFGIVSSAELNNKCRRWQQSLPSSYDCDDVNEDEAIVNNDENDEASVSSFENSDNGSVGFNDDDENDDENDE